MNAKFSQDDSGNLGGKEVSRSPQSKLERSRQSLQNSDNGGSGQRGGWLKRNSLISSSF